MTYTMRKYDDCRYQNSPCSLPDSLPGPHTRPAKFRFFSAATQDDPTAAHYVQKNATGRVGTTEKSTARSKHEHTTPPHKKVATRRQK